LKLRRIGAGILYGDSEDDKVDDVVVGVVDVSTQQLNLHIVMVLVWLRADARVYDKKSLSTSSLNLILYRILIPIDIFQIAVAQAL
jgi:hypothetical protein